MSEAQTTRAGVPTMIAKKTHQRLRLAAAISGKKVQDLASELLEKQLDKIPGLAEAEKSAGEVKFSRRGKPAAQPEEVAA